LPIYFACSGLDTDLGNVNTLKAWAFVFLIFLVACVGKIIGCGAAAKLMGLSVRESLAIGISMNTRGLLAIIMLNLSLEGGLINSKIYSLFLIMILMTTFLVSYT
jgi:Kef-type K+ transport system membrane component KefB